MRQIAIVVALAVCGCGGEDPPVPLDGLGVFSACDGMSCETPCTQSFQGAGSAHCVGLSPTTGLELECGGNLSTETGVAGLSQTREDANGQLHWGCCGYRHNESPTTVVWLECSAGDPPDGF
jgi:hypothetical protein